ncbi:TPA: hypothetical protein QH661_003709 [Escherichia coli]|nr:hypothetical protein [Citrobacter koseri]HBC5655905.1 hypothetical protein [Citrobacter koseri]HDS8187783.1 hypothetical protein [Escherichia coli]HDV9918620.1 hypothetical protein [Escherichia coli]
MKSKIVMQDGQVIEFEEGSTEHFSFNLERLNIDKASYLYPTEQQLDLWRKATGSTGGLNEYREWVLIRSKE